MKSAPAVSEQAKARIDFRCLTEECTGVIGFNIREIAEKDFQAVCPVCHRAYALDAALRDKLERMMKLIEALRNSEDILGDSVVSVNVAGGEVRARFTSRGERIFGVRWVLPSLDPKLCGTG